MHTIQRLLENNRRFAAQTDDTDVAVHDPEFVSVCCCDARLSQGALFGTSPGSHFTVANIGNSVRTHDETGTPVLSGSVLYPVLETDPQVVFVVGHTDCGAITAAYRYVADGVDSVERIEPGRAEIQNELDLLIPYVERGLERIDTDAHGDFETIVRLAEFNVDRQVENLSEAVESVPVIGAVCDLHGAYSGERGEVHVVNYGGTRGRDDMPGALGDYYERTLEY